MKPPRPGWSKQYAVKWLNVTNGEEMYSGAMTKEEAELLVSSGHWHIHACPIVQKLEDRP